jgi:hypothetical protein
LFGQAVIQPVQVVNTPNVNVVNTPSVNVANTPTVALSSCASVAVTNPARRPGKSHALPQLLRKPAAR